MENYKEMYYKLFNKITDVIGELQDIQKETEKIFISGESDQIKREPIDRLRQDL